LDTNAQKCFHCQSIKCKCRTFKGVGPDAPTTTNTAGGKQSKLAFRSDVLPPAAIVRTALVLTDGAARYGKDNWRKIPQTDHLNHAMAHLFAHFGGDTSDDHLSHAACRILFAMETTDEPS
jgi:Domain of unknown function (DUF5664)